MNSKKHTDKELEAAVAYGIGIVCGKHNLNMTQKDIKRYAKNWRIDKNKHHQ